MKPTLATKSNKPNPDTVHATLEQVLAAERAFGAVGMHKLSMRAAYAVARMMDALESEAKAFRRVNQATIKEMGVVRPSTVKERAMGAEDTVTAVRPELEEEYQRRLEELHNQSVTIARAPISLATLKAGCPVCNTERVIDLEPSVIKALGPFVTE